MMKNMSNSIQFFLSALQKLGFDHAWTKNHSRGDNRDNDYIVLSLWCQVGASGGQYRGYEQYRGPQYWADKGLTPVLASNFSPADPGVMEKVGP